MATLMQGQQQNEEEKDQQTGPMNVSGTPSAAITPAAPGQMQQAGRRTQGSGRFTNLQKYISASGGAGQQIAGKIGQDVGKETQKLGQAVEGAGAVQNQLQAERDRLKQATGIAQQIQQDPTKLTGQVADVRRLATGQTDLDQINRQKQQVFDVAQQQLGNVQQLSNLTGTEQGRFELLRRSLGRPSYSRGQQRLDQLLVQADGADTLGNLQRQTAQQAAQGAELVGTRQGELANLLEQARTEAQGAQTAITGALGGFDDPSTPNVDESKGALGSLQQRLTAAATQRQQTNQDIYNRAREQLAAGELDADVAEALGLTNVVTSTINPLATDFTKLQQRAINIGDIGTEDLLSRLQRGTPTVTAANVATEDDLARYNALKQLAGLTGPTPLNLSKDAIGQVSGPSIDAQRLQADAQARINELGQRFTGSNVDSGASRQAFTQAATAEATRRIDQQLAAAREEMKNDPRTRSANQLRINDLENAKKNINQSIQSLLTDPRISTGLTVGQLQGNADNNLGSTLGTLVARAVNPNFRVGENIPTIDNEIARNLIRGTSAFGDIQRSTQQLYDQLGLGRTIRIRDRS